jgi:hypothetical protein
MEEPAAVSEAAKLIVVAGIGARKVGEDTEHATVTGSESSLRVELRPMKISAKVGRREEFEIRMVNRSDRTIEIFNPFLNGLLAPTRALSLPILTRDGVEIGDVMTRSLPGSSRPPLDTSDWLDLPAGGFTSLKRPFLVGAVPGTDFDGSVDLLPAGQYFLELRAHAPLISGCPPVIKNPQGESIDDVINSPAYREWRFSFPGPEICRSNRVELEILPRTGD